MASCAAAVALLAGCNDTTVATPAATPSAATPSVSAPTTTVAAPATSAVPAAGHQGTGSGGGVDLTVTVPGSTTIKLDGDAIAFDFTLTNPSATATSQAVGVVAAMGRCSCGPGGAKMSPQGTMQLLDASSNTWKPVTFVREGTGMDYLLEPVIPSTTLAPGQSTTYHMKVTLNQDPQVHYTAGTGAITVTLEVPGKSLKSLGSATVPITVQP
ncbi:hypothetical protein ACFXHA_02935 [Nocardia sp. NPDC059240]|uniref:hypothetical protein n=1 Tax=Nocardia sp. NPDC059240 TaxID=3346786 RepID=UPI00367E2965